MRRVITICAAAGAVAGVTAGCGTARSAPATGSARASTVGGPLSVKTLAGVAGQDARSLGDRHVRSALVVFTRKHAAENWMEPRSDDPRSSDPPAYVIAISGRFQCQSCSFPAGAHAPTGRSAQLVYVPGEGATDFGLTERLPPGLGRLGRVVRIPVAG
jgi:hypothetical protein